MDRKDATAKPSTQPAPDVPEEEAWKQTLHVLLTQKLSPAGFEKLVQRVLRESGFTQVEVTGRTGDGGIDGRGIARIHGFMSFHVLFQCKRYKGSVSAGEIRDFHGAMVGRADKGLFISTGTFSPSAIKEATRDGAPKELGLGVRKEIVAVPKVDEKWFEEF